MVSENGITGWMLTVYFIASACPMPKSQLFWNGTLMRFATGFCSFLARSASLSPEGASSAMETATPAIMARRASTSEA